MIAAVNSQEEQNYSRYLIVETLDEKSFLRAGEVFSFHNALTVRSDVTLLKSLSQPSNV